MRRFFVKNILFIIAVNVLIKPVWVFLIDRNVQNRVAPGDYGTYQALMSLSIIFQTLLDFGITNYNSRTISMNPERLPEIFPAMLSARFILMVSYITIAFTGGWLLGYRGWELGLLVGILIFQALNALVLFLRSNVAALHRFKTDGILSSIDRLLMIFICGILFIAPATRGTFKIEWFIWSQGLSYLLATIVSYIILRNIGKVRLKFSLQPKEVLKIMKQSLPYALLVFQMSVYNRADAMMIERMGQNGKIQADIWAAAFRLLEVANMLGLIFATMLLPLFGRMLSQKQDVSPILRVCVNILLPFSFMVAVAAGYYSKDIMPMLYKACTRDPSLLSPYVLVFAILMASFPAWCIMYVYSTLLTANGSMNQLNLIAFAGVIVNLSLNFWLIPQYGVIGGAITSCVTQSLLALIFMLVAWWSLKLPVSPRWILAHLGFLAIIIGLGKGVQIYVNISWVLQAVVYGAICLVLMFIFRFITVKSLKDLAGFKGGE